jgi:ABC-type transporter Mla subunit MlaD
VNSGHFKLGLFVILAVGLLAVMLLMLGVLERLKPSVTIETYFSEDIQGLRPGAVVRYRGVQIGTVGRIGFPTADYPEARQDESRVFAESILVKMIIDAAVFSSLHIEDIKSNLEDSIARGLRARLTTTGLGGPAYVELNFLDPERFPAPDVAWTPDDLFLPSAPSTIGSVLGALEAILLDVEGSDLIDNLAALASIGPDVRRLVDALESDDLFPTATASLQELRAASVEVQRLLADERVDRLLDDATTTLETVPALVDDLTMMANSLESAAVSLDGLARTVEETGLIPQLRAMADDFGPAGSDLRELARRLDRLVAANGAQLADTIRSLRHVALQLEALLEDVEANPSRMIFGDPPPRRTPGGAP